MSESDPRRRPSLSRWLSEKVDELTGGLVFGKPGPGEPGLPRPDEALPPEPAVRPEPEPLAGIPDAGPEPVPAPPPPAEVVAAEPEPLPVPVIPETEHKAVLARLKRELDDAQLMLIGKEAEFKNDLQKLQERNAELLDRVVRLTQRERELEAKILDAKFEGSGAKAEAKRLDGELRDLRRVLKAKEAEAATLGARIEALEAQSAALSPEAETERAARLEALAAQTAALEQALAEARRERDAAAARLDEARAAAAAAAVVPAAALVAAEVEPDLAAPVPEPAITPDPPLVALPPPRPARRRVTGLATEPLLTRAAGQLPEAAARLLTLRARRENAAAAWTEHLRRVGGAAVPAEVLAELFPPAPASSAVANGSGPRPGGEGRGGEGRGGEGHGGGRRPRRRSR
jgi:hypothetical protein